MKQKHWIISIFFSSVICLQFLMPALRGGNVISDETRIWPFMNYCMYAQPRFDPPRTHTFKLLGHFADGTQEEINGDTIGQTIFALEEHYTRPLRLQKEGETAATVKLAEAIEHNLSKTVTRIEQQETVYEIQGDDVIETIKLRVFHLPGNLPDINGAGNG